jgi:hypothetical protein
MHLIKYIKCKLRWFKLQIKQKWLGISYVSGWIWLIFDLFILIQVFLMSLLQTLSLHSTLDVDTVQFWSICHPYVTVTCLTKFSFCQPGRQAVTTVKFRQTRPDNSQNYHIWVGVTIGPFVRQPSDLWQTPNFVLSEGPVMCDWWIDWNCTVKCL